MILSLFKKRSDTPPVYDTYGAIVEQARRPVFYAEWFVPDTVTGRFDMISLHMALLFRRLRGDDTTERDYSQAVFDLWFKDMDRSLREMGVTDIGVPKKIQKMGNIFFGLLAALNQALDSGDVDAVAAVLERNVFSEVESAGTTQLAQYLMTQDAVLARQDSKAILDGHISFEPV